VARGRLLLVLVLRGCAALAALTAPFPFGERVAQAEETAPLPLDLEWQAPEECPSAEAIRTELGRIARVRPGRAQIRLSAQGRIEKEAGRYRLTLRTERSGTLGERHLVSSECRSLGREVTLVLAVAFGEGVELVPDEASPDEPHRPEKDGADQADGSQAPPSAPRAHEEPRSAPAPASPPPGELGSSRKSGTSRTSLFVGGGVLLGALPRPAVLATLGGDLGSRRFWVSPRVTWLPRTDDSLPRGVQARYSGLGGTLSGCAGFPATSWFVAGCVGGGATALRGRSWGASESETATAPWYTGNASASVTWPRDGVVALRLVAELQVSLNEPRFVVEGLGDAHRVSRLAPSFALQIVLSPGRRSSARAVPLPPPPMKR
jgi:hypothetical protein